VKEVRGMGLLLGIVLEKEIAKDMKQALQKAGVLVNAPTSDVLRIAPALIVTSTDVTKFVSTFSKVLKEVNHG
jgi:acetylornithine aminotransferase